jgi:prepilin-type N-terminal cleavage/methylation domain-containing protein
MQRKIRNKAGFTLTEMLVVAAIIAILGGGAVMSIRGRAPYFRMDHARMQIIGDMRSARQAAVSIGTKVSVTFNDSSKSYTIWVDKDMDGVVDAGEEKTKTLSDFPGMTMVSSPSSGFFTSMGCWITSASSIALTLSPVGTRTIYITPSGEVDSDG